MKVWAYVSGLASNTTYQFSASATSVTGTGTDSLETFTTPAGIPATDVTEAASSITQTTATLNASVNPNSGELTECEFQFGTTTHYGSSAPCMPAPGSGSSPIAVSAAITNLSPGTTYHFRIATNTNWAGRSNGADETFTTSPPNLHWLHGLTRIEEAQKVPYISWGQLALANVMGATIAECSDEVGGHVENPAGGGPGIEVTEAWSAYDCTAPECEAAGGKPGIGFENESGPGVDVALNWPGELTEAAGGVVRLKSTNVRVYFHCQFAAPSPTEKPGKGSIEGLEERQADEYNAPTPATCTTSAPGFLSPRLLPGTGAEKPSKLEFSGGAGGELECGSGTKVIFSGRLRMMGYAESEVLFGRKA